MKSNAKRILSFVLVLLMSLSMLTGIVLPAAAGTDASDPYAKITGTKDGVAIVPDANVYFVNPAWATAPAADGETFEYTYGDGTTWGNGKTYLLTWKVNAFAVLNEMHTLLTTLSTHWVNKIPGAKQEVVFVVAPGATNLNRNYTLAEPATSVAPEQLFSVTLLGPQAGKNPVNDKRDSKAEVLKVQNGRSVDVTKEAVFNGLVRPWGYANWTFDGFAATGAGAFFLPEANSLETNILIKNYFISGMTTGFQNAFIYVQPDTATMIEFKDSYLDLKQTTKAGTSTGSLIFGNKFTFDNCAFVNGNYIANMANQITWAPDRAQTGKAHATFFGAYAAKPEFTVKNCVVADWDHINMFNFNTGYTAKSANFTVDVPYWGTYTGNAVKVNFEGNKVYDVNVNNAARGRMIHFNKIDTAEKAGSFELNITDNLFSFSDEKFASAGAVHSVLYTDDTPNNIKIKSTIKENVVKSPNKNIVIPFWDGTTLKDGPLFDLSGNLFLDNAGNVLPVRSWHSQNSTTKYWKAQSDLYASDEMKGGIKELMSIKEVEDGVVTCTDIQLADRAADAAKKNYLQGRVTLILKDGKEYDADELFTFDDGVEFLGVYAEEACTTKVETVNKTNVHGKFAKAQYKTANTTLTVVYALYTPHTFLIVDPAGTYKTEGYTFNGVKYEDCKTAADGISAKFFTTIAEAYGTDGANMPPFHFNTIDSLKTQSTTYTLEGIGERTYPFNYIGTGTVILLTPGEHVIGASASGAGNMALRKHVAIVGPQWGVSPYGDANKNGELANGRSTNAATEALINGYFTPAADSGWINTVFDGVVFDGTGYAVNLSHNNGNTSSLYQIEIMKNCIFDTEGGVVVGPATAATSTKVLDVTIKDCVFDTTALDRRELDQALITLRASVADIANVSVLNQYCVEDEAAALISLSTSTAAPCTVKDNAQKIGTYNFYAEKHAEDLVVDESTSTATCITGGTATASCPVCGKTETIEVAATGKHDFDTTKWVQGETTHYHACKTVGCTAKDAETAHVESEVKIDTPAGCSSNGKGHTECTVCGKVINNNVVIPSDGKHNIDTSKWATDGNGHWHACTSAGCTEKADYADHTESELIIDQAPTELIAGSAHSECTVCKKVIKANVVLPATNEELADRFAAITATDANNDGVYELGSDVVFVDPAFGSGKYTDTFTYTYGDGVTFGNGATYELTFGVNAFNKLYKATQAVKAAWNAHTGAADAYTGPKTIVVAPGLYNYDASSGGNFTETGATDVFNLPKDKNGNEITTPAYDELFRFTVLGPQAGLSPVTDTIDDANPAPSNNRSVDTKVEAVCNTTVRGVQNAIMRVDGFSFTGSWKMYDDAAKNTIVAVELHNIYHYVSQDVIHWQWTESYDRTRCLEIKNFYKDYTGLGDTVTLESDWLGSMGRLIIDNYYEDMTGITKSGSENLQARQLNIGIVGYASAAQNLFGDGDKRVEIQIKNSTYNSHTNNHAFRFFFHHANQYVGYTTDDVIIDMHDNYFRNMGWGGLTNKTGGAVTGGCDTIYIQGLNKEANGNDKAIQMAADALKFDFERNTFEYTSDIMKTRTSGHTLINFRTGAKAVFGKFNLKNNRVIMSTEGARPIYPTTANGYVLNASSWLYTNENGEVIQFTRNPGNSPASDAYAGDDFAGGINEMFTPVRGADMAIATADTNGVINNGYVPTKNITGTVMIVPYADAGTYAAEELFEFRGKDVEVVKLLDASGAEVTGKVNPNAIDGYKLVTQYKGKTTVCTVTLTIKIAPDSEYAFIDPTGSVTSYEFNGKTYTLDDNNRFTDFNGNAAGTNYRKIQDAGKNVIVFLPGEHSWTSNYQFYIDAALLGPGFGKSPLTEDFGLSTERHITKSGNNYTVDLTKEAVLKSAITPWGANIEVNVDGIVIDGFMMTYQFADQSYGTTEGGSIMSGSISNSFAKSWNYNGFIYGSKTAAGVYATNDKSFAYLNEVYVAGKGDGTSDQGYLLDAVDVADMNRVYVENVKTGGCLARIYTSDGSLYKLSPAEFGMKITNSKFDSVWATWNMFYTNWHVHKNDWGSSGVVDKEYFPKGFYTIIDNNIFNNLGTAGTAASKDYVFRLMSPPANDWYFTFTNNTITEDAPLTKATFYYLAPMSEGNLAEFNYYGNKFINLNNNGLYFSQHYPDGSKVDISENYWATVVGGKESVMLVTPMMEQHVTKSDWYYLDRAMTVKNTDVALLDNGYKSFENKGFDGINNFVIDASESDLANLFKAAEGATVEGIYADAACTQATTAASGTVYVKVSKNGISLANKVELTACDHKDKGTEDKITKDPTCYQTGLKDIVCAACGTALETGKEVAATGNHEWKTEWTITDTEHYKGCKTDGCTAKNEVAAHTESETVVDEAPGCSSAGKGHTVCTVCNKTINANVTIPSTGKHSAADELVVDKAPTCYASGIGHSVCKDCGVTIQSNVTIPATEAHNWATEWTITDNLHYYECTNDGCTFRNSAATHTAGDIITDKAPSCYEAGYGHKDCTICGKTMETNVAIPATGNHSWKNEWVQGDITHYHECSVEGCPAKGAENAHEKELITVIPETCGEAGLGKYVCKVCDVLLEDNVVIQPTGKHTKGGLEIYEGMEPNCGYTGLGYKSCTVCGQIVEDNIVIAIRGEHVPGAVVMDQVAGCTTAGKGHIDCTVCGKLLDNVVVAATHTPGEWASLQPGKEAQSCSVCGIILEIRDVLPEGSAPVDPAERFDDVDADDWYFEAVTFVVDEGLFNGTSDTEFSPNENMTRAMFVTVLGRLHGVKETKASTQFTDVKKSAYYSGYVAWAAKNSIVKGVSDTKFAPDANITREQIAVMMVRYMDFAKISAKKINTKITFKDASSISGYAKSAVATCQTGGIVNGIKVSGGYNFNPKANATRAQVATIMMNFCENYK